MKAENIFLTMLSIFFLTAFIGMVTTLYDHCTLEARTQRCIDTKGEWVKGTEDTYVCVYRP